VKIAIIPARSGSKRVKNKNIKIFNGKPMIAWPILAAKKSNLFEHIIVSTDSKKISKISKRYGAIVPFLRNKKLSSDRIGINEVINDVIKKSDLEKKIKFICCIMATSPFLKSKNLISADKMIRRKKNNFVFSAVKISNKILRSFTIDKRGKLKMIDNKYYNINSQNLKETYLDAGQFYFGKKSSWIKKKMIYSKNSSIIEIAENGYADIDTPADWKRALKLIKK
tara:strand:- start:581 stop:1255 length:675 start_codon:yes stop_codon:yes gene_type:complete